MRIVLSIVLILISNCLLAQSIKFPVEREIINWCLEQDSIVKASATIIKEQGAVIDSLKKDKEDLNKVIHNQDTMLINRSKIIHNKDSVTSLYKKDNEVLIKKNRTATSIGILGVILGILIAL